MRTLWVGLLFSAATLALVAHGQDVIEEATRDRSRIISRDYFGTHFHRLELIPQERGKYIQTSWPKLDFGTIRLWDARVRWGDIAKSPGQWDFQRMDAYIHLAKKHSAKVLYTLGSTPQWASARPSEPCPYGLGCAAEPVRTAHWEEYIRRLSNRYGDQIEAYELWNEPYFSDFAIDRAQPVSFFSGSADRMVELARNARHTLDQVNPRALLTTPGFLGGGQRHLNLFLGAGGKQHVQVIAYHFYSENPIEFATKILEVRSIMRRHGVEHLPLWNTETGVEVWPENTPLPPGVKKRIDNRQAGARMAQFLILGAASGLDRYYYYAWDNERSGMVDPSGERLDRYEAMARVQNWLIGSKTKGCKSNSSDVIECLIESDGDRYLIAWAETFGEKVVSLPVGSKAVEIETLYANQTTPKYREEHGQIRLHLDQSPLRIRLTTASS